MIVRELITLLGFQTDAQSLRVAEAKVNAVADRMVNAGRKMSMFLTLPIAAAGVALIKASSDAVELQNKFNQVFRGMEDDANAWSESFAKSVGRSRFAVRESMASFQSFFVGMGFGAKEANKMTMQMEELAIDFGSFNNLADAEASQRFIAAMSGSAEVLDRFGINLKASALDLELQSLGLAKSTVKANEQQKAVARLSLIQKAMTSQGATGDAVRTLGEFANRLRQVTSAIRDVSVSFGAQMLPWMNRLLAIALPLLAWMDNLSDSSKRYILIVGLLVAAIGPLLLFGGSLLKLIVMLTPAIRAAIIVGAILALVFEDIATWIEGGDSLIGQFLGSWVDFRAKIAPILNWLREWFGVNLPILFSNFAAIIKGVVIPAIIEAANQAWAIIGPLVMGIVALFQLGFSVLQILWEKYGSSIIAGVMDFVKTAMFLFGWLYTGLFQVVSGVFKLLGGVLKFIGGVFTLQWRTAWEGIKDIFTGIWDIIMGSFISFISTIKLLAKIVSTFLGLGKNASVEALKNVTGIVKTVGTAAVIAGTSIAGTGEAISPEAISAGVQSVTNAPSQITLQPIVNVDVGSVRSDEDADAVASATQQAVSQALEKEARKIQTSFPEVE